MDELLKRLQTASREELIAKLANALGECETLRLALEDAKGTRTWCQSRLDKFMAGQHRAEVPADTADRLHLVAQRDRYRAAVVQVHNLTLAELELYKDTLNAKTIHAITDKALSA